ncbi:MAG: class I SAM-dependent methyltransferase [Chloroflexota bacterium]
MDPSFLQEHGKIPWDDPDFSRRMLREHLYQRYDAASRRTSVIKKHVNWIHRYVLSEQPASILDLGCGPGLYSSRLAEFGHQCVGIDFSPASIDYARMKAKKDHLTCQYRQEDIRIADYGSGFDLVMLVFSEFNTFEPGDANLILERSFQSLRLGGKILLEVPSFDAVEQIGNQPSVWYTEKKGIFSDEPYLCLTESFWNENDSLAIERYYIIHGASNDVDLVVNSTQAYEDEQFINFLEMAGFSGIEFHPSLTGSQEQQLDGMFVILGNK